MSGIEEEPRSEHDFAEDFGADLLGFLNGESAADTAVEAPAEEQVAEEDTDTGESRPEVIEDATGRLHGKDGKFVEKPSGDSQEGESQEGEEAPEETAEEDSGDDFVIEVDDEETADRVASVLEKYDGDPAKALVALAEAQSLIGRKGNEAAQANAKLEAVEAELAAIKQGQEAVLSRLSQPVVPITRELIETDPAGAAQQAVLQDNVEALEAAISVWQNGSDYVDANPEAARFFLEKLALEAQLAERDQAATTTSMVEPAQAELDAEVGKVLEKHPDLEQYLPAIAEAANEHPLLKRSMEAGTPSERAQALLSLTEIAKSRQGADTSREALKRVQIRVKQEADDAKAKARVVSASRSSAATSSQPTRVDKFLEAFDARMGLNADED